MQQRGCLRRRCHEDPPFAQEGQQATRPMGRLQGDSWGTSWACKYTTGVQPSNIYNPTLAYIEHLGTTKLAWQNYT